MSFKQVYLTEPKLRELLNRLSVTIISETNKDLLCYCPFHSNRDSPAFAINKSAPYKWVCNNGACAKRGNIFTLLTQKGYTRSEAEHMLKAGYIEPDDFLGLIEALLMAEQEEFNEWSDIDWNMFVEWDETYDFPARTYVLGRGVSLQAYQYFGLGYSRTRHRVVIPVRDECSVLIGLIGRSIEQKDYQYSKSLKRHRTIWNLCNVTNSASIILTEGAFDAISIWDAGLKNVGAIFGSNMSEDQQKLLRNRFYEIICFFDNDAAGYAATEQVIDSFPDLMVSYVEYPKRLVELADGSSRPVKDPGELSIDEINQMILARKSKYTKLWS